ncbi:MAG: M48 family metallopeptidase [Oligoflexia bacterium]|nr:M48 family metallopeptidase [Oligoflexia bacterium]
MLTIPLMLKSSFLFFLLLKTTVQLYLNIRNCKYVLKKRDRVPDKFNTKIGLQDHQKAQDYTVANLTTGRFFLLIDVALLLFWTLGGGIKYLDNYLFTFSYFSIQNIICHGVMLYLVFSFINMLLSLPEEIYSTFVIEEKFGFNRTTIKTFIIDHLKGIALMLIIGIPLLASLLWIMMKLGQFWWLYAWIFLTLVQLIMMWIYPVLIAPWFNKFSPMPDGAHKDEVIKLLNKTGFNYKGLFVMDASKRSNHGNAYFTGWGKNRRIVFFDTLLSTLEPQEVVAVLAHELGHFKYKHILKGMLMSIVLSLLGLYILGVVANAEWFYSAMNVTSFFNDGLSNGLSNGLLWPNHFYYLALITFSLIVPCYTFFITPIFAWHSRKNEFMADRFAAENADANMLISALIKMYKENASTLTPDPLYAKFYYSHPDALARVEFLESLGTRT